MFHQHLLQEGLGYICITISYICFILSYLCMIYDAHRYKVPAAPLLAICTQWGIAFLVGFVGPWAEPRLFPPADSTFTIWLWRFVTLCWTIIFVQYLLYGRPSALTDRVKQYFHQIAIGSLIAWTVTAWLYILFARDYYVNESYPLATLLMSIAFFAAPILRSNLLGLSIVVAWLLVIATALLYFAIIFGGMHVSYPCHSVECFPPDCFTDEFCTQLSDTCAICHEPSGYAFMFWLFGLTVLALLIYAIILTRRRDELKPAES